MSTSKPIHRTGRFNRSREEVIDRIERENHTYLVIESTGGMPCSACCFQPCSTRPEFLEPCACYRNSYGKNIYYKKILNPLKPCKETETTKAAKPSSRRRS